MRLASTLLLIAVARVAAQCSNTCSGSSGESFVNDGDCDDGGPGAEFYVPEPPTACPYGSDCADCGERSVLYGPNPPPAPTPPPPSPGVLPSCADEFFSAYDRAACVENIEMLPVDLFAGGSLMLLVVLPNIVFYAGLCCKRWKRCAKALECPFTGESAFAECRVCHTRVGGRALVRTCSVSTSQTSGGITTVTTSTTHNWDHCLGCHYLKSNLLLVLILLGMFGLWVYTVIERVVAVTGVGYRDERIRWFNATVYMLAIVVALINTATVWCARKTLLKFTCAPPWCCAARASPTPTSAPAPTRVTYTSSSGAPAPAASAVEMRVAAPAVADKV